MRNNTSVRIVPAQRRAPIDFAIAPEAGNSAPCTNMCSTCNLRELCQPCCGLTRSAMDVAERLVFNRSRVRRGDCLYRTGDRFTSLYAVRSGFFKSTAVLENGRNQVTGFTMTGEVMGMDGIGPEHLRYHRPRGQRRPRLPFARLGTGARNSKPATPVP
jgi:hypothetical protein